MPRPAMNTIRNLEWWLSYCSNDAMDEDILENLCHLIDGPARFGIYPLNCGIDSKYEASVFVNLRLVLHQFAESESLLPAK